MASASHPGSNGRLPRGMTAHQIEGQRSLDDGYDEPAAVRTATRRLLQLGRTNRARSDSREPPASESSDLTVVVPVEPPELTSALARALLVVVAKARSASSGHHGMEDLSSKAS